jgi:hypothetical protein
MHTLCVWKHNLQQRQRYPPPSRGSQGAVHGLEDDRKLVQGTFEARLLGQLKTQERD